MLARDERHDRPLVRFSACDAKVNARHGFMDQARGAGGKSLQVVEATGKVLKQFCTVKHGVLEGDGKSVGRNLVQSHPLQNLRCWCQTVPQMKSRRPTSLVGAGCRNWQAAKISQLKKVTRQAATLETHHTVGTHHTLGTHHTVKTHFPMFATS